MLAKSFVLTVMALTLLVGCASRAERAAPPPVPEAPKDLAQAPAEPPVEGKAPPPGPAPDFTLRDATGEEFSLATLRADRPVALYFIQEDCPVNTEAVPFFKELAAAHRESVEFVGIIDADGAKRDAWSQKHAPGYKLLGDPDLTVTKAYGVQRSPWLILVSKEGDRIGEWMGFSAGMLEEMNQALATAAGKPAPQVGFAGAPVRAQYG